jgi:hypothetical protein
MFLPRSGYEPLNPSFEVSTRPNGGIKPGATRADEWAGALRVRVRAREGNHETADIWRPWNSFGPAAPAAQAARRSCVRLCRPDDACRWFGCRDLRIPGHALLRRAGLFDNRQLPDDDSCPGGAGNDPRRRGWRRRQRRSCCGDVSLDLRHLEWRRAHCQLDVQSAHSGSSGEYTRQRFERARGR